MGLRAAALPLRGPQHPLLHMSDVQPPVVLSEGHCVGPRRPRPDGVSVGVTTASTVDSKTL